LSFLIFLVSDGISFINVLQVYYSTVNEKVIILELILSITLEYFKLSSRM
jgi:hypothetical protein